MTLNGEISEIRFHKSSASVRMAFSQKSCRPSVGSLERVAKTFFHDGSSWCATGGWPSPIPVRAANLKMVPADGHLELLGCDTLLHSAKYACSQALEAGCPVSPWLDLFRSCAVCFRYFPDGMDAEAEKWRLEDQSQVKADERVLIGFNQVLAVHGVWQMLSTPSHPATNEQVAKFFSKGRVKSMPEKTVSTLLKIRKRFTPECIVLWQQARV